MSSLVRDAVDNIQQCKLFDLHSNKPDILNSNQPTYGGGGGGGMSGDLEGRVERLEANLSSAKKSLATLVERTSHLATKADLKDEVGAIGARITWSIFVPLLLVVLGWLGKEFFK